MTVTVDDMVRREVLCCLSSLVSTLAQGYSSDAFTGSALKFQPARDLRDLSEQAFDLACPVDDWEEAANQSGYKIETIGANDWQFTAPDGTVHGGYSSQQEAAANAGLEPYEWEVFEHWSVSQWLAEKLIEQGEKVDTDFAGMNVWARTCTGQGIANDGPIQRIHAAMVRS